MKKNVRTPDEYIALLPAERKNCIQKLRQIILQNIPKGFEETINYGMIGYVIPHSSYPEGYHCDPKLPLPFINIGSQKNYVSLYHMGIYALPELLEWFVTAYPKHSKKKLDMGKSCIRFKNPDDIPFALIGELCTKMTPTDWISLYEKQLRR